MSELVQTIRSQLFANVPRDRDAYHAEISSLIRPGITVLDAGCGKGVLNAFPWQEHPKVHLVGLDPDPEAEANPHLDEFVLMQPDKDWDVPDESADLIIARYVLEHVEDPWQFLQSVRRVLKPGGRFVFLTPSRYYPVMLASSMMPLSLHQAILARTKKSANNDVFETHYKLNTKTAIRRHAKTNGFEVESLVQRDFQPADYFDFNVLLFACNLSAWGLGKALRLDRSIGASILGVFRKPEKN